MVLFVVLEGLNRRFIKKEALYFFSNCEDMVSALTR